MRRLLIAAVAVAWPISAAAEVLIGVAAPITGRFSAQGQAIRAAVDEAVAKANADGGLLGAPMKVVAVDDACEGKAGAEAAGKMVALKPAVVIGHPCASAALAAAPIYAQSGIILLALTRHPALTDKRAGPTIFRMAGRDDRQGEAIADFLNGRENARRESARIALVHDRTAYGKSIVEGVQRGLSAAGRMPVLVEGVIASEKDYGALGARIKLANADIVVFGGYPAEAAVLRHSIIPLRGVGGEPLGPILIGGDALAADVISGTLPDFAFVRVPIATGHNDTAMSDDPSTNLSAQALSVWRRAATVAKSVEPAAVVAIFASSKQLSAPGVGEALAAPVAPNSSTAGLFAPNGDALIPSFKVYRSVGGKLFPAD